MIKILKLFRKKEWLLIALSVVFIAVQVWLDLKIPDYMQKITILIQTPGSQIGDVWSNGLMMVLCAICSLISAVIVCFIASKISAVVSFKLKSSIYKKVNEFGVEEINKFSTASLITRSTNDVSQMQMFIFMGVQTLIKAPILAVWAIIKISGKAFEWSLATFIAVLALFIIIGVVMTFVIPKFKILQKQIDNMNAVTRETLSGVRVVRAFNAENFQQEKFDKANNDLTATGLFTHKILATLFPLINLIFNLLPLSIFWIGAYLVRDAVDKLTTFADLVVFTSYAMQVVMAFMMIIIVLMTLPRASISAKRINEVLDTKTTINNGAVSSISNNVLGKIEFKDVCFKYPNADEYVLEDINFTVNKGETIAFIGSTGSGKSTLINLIPRFYDASSGKVLIDDIDVKDYNQKLLHNKVGYVSQKAVVFAGSVKDNLTFGENDCEITDEDIKQSAEIAMASDFIEKLDGGYDFTLAQSGTNLSGGQKQRISIARALARKPEILIFDDSFSALDYKTDKQLRENLKEKAKDVTKVIVAQRIGTIMDADKIVVLDSGKVVGEGTHDELMKSCEIYQEIAYSQLSKEELENE